MKKNIIKTIKTFVVLTSLFFVHSCSEDNDNLQFQYSEPLGNGISFSIIDIPSSSFEYSKPNEALFEINGELRGAKGDETVSVYATFSDKTNTGTDNSVKNKVLIKTYQPESLTKGVNFPELNIKVTLNEVLSALGLNFSQINPTDEFTIYEEIKTPDGRVFSSEQITNSLRGSGYATPLENTVAVGCSVDKTKYSGKYEMTTNGTGYWPEGPQEVEIKTLDVFGSREVSFVYAGSFKRTFKFNIVCDQIIIPEVSTGLSCGSGDIVFKSYGNTIAADLTSDNEINLNLLTTGSCGLNANVEIKLVKK